jgi:alpha-glucosidase (family GH31 glycosyl hydrolase)
MWMHYPDDKIATKMADQFLWGNDLLIAPIYEKAATARKVYLPKVIGMIGGQTQNKAADKPFPVC